MSDSDKESGERTVSGSRQQTDLADDDDSDIGSDWSREQWDDCALPLLFFHNLAPVDKGEERQDWDISFVSSSSFVMVVVVVVDVVSCESQGHFRTLFLS